MALIAAAAAILLFLTLFSFWLKMQLFRDTETAEALNRYNSKLAEFVQILGAVESSQRGYLLAGTPGFLTPYTRMSGDLLPLAEELVAGVPKQLPGAKTISPVIPLLKAKLGEMAQTIAFADGGQKEQAIELLKDGLGRKLTGEIEAKVHKVQAEGDALIQSNGEKQRWLQSFKLVVDGIGALVILIFSFLSLSLLLRSNVAIQAAQEELARTNLELEETVAHRTAALTRANEEIQRFAYIVSHDLRSPLVNIMGFTSELETLGKELFRSLNAANGQPVPENLAEDFDEAFGFIKSSITRMDSLISAILRISREGGRPLRREPIDMNALVEGIIAATAHQIREKGAIVTAGSLPPLVTDRIALEQIFSNLIDNAIKFLRPGVQGSIAVEGETRGGETVYTVSDNGRGIDPKDHQRIFELFRRSGQQDIPGEGIGLAYVAASVRRLGGTIEVESALGHGSIFKVKLPVRVARRDREAA
ncbi:MAG: ATP-binding protein [Rhodomicrobium sp.]